MLEVVGRSSVRRKIAVAAQQCPEDCFNACVDLQVHFFLTSLSVSIKWMEVESEGSPVNLDKKNRTHTAKKPQHG